MTLPQPHEDGPAYFPVVTTLSLGSHTILNLYKYKEGQDADGKVIDPSPICSIYLPARSLFVMRDELYTQCLFA
jgi:alkylated DNA repair protein alkB family protein 6